MKFVRAALASAVFAGFLVLFYVLHIRFFTVDVVLYSAMLDGILATVAAGALLFRLERFALFGAFEKTQLAVIWLLAAALFAISIPTVIDRSLSFYILEKLQQRGGAIQKERMKDVFTQEYVEEHRLVDVRLTEQMVSGTIVIENGCVKLTARGERLATFSRFFRQHLLPRQRLLMGTYSDDLTDPFRGSRAGLGYECK